MVGFDAVVGVLLGVMGDVEQHLVDYPRQRSGQIGDDLGGPVVRTLAGGGAMLRDDASRCAASYAQRRLSYSSLFMPKRGGTLRARCSCRTV